MSEASILMPITQQLQTLLKRKNIKTNLIITDVGYNFGKISLDDQFFTYINLHKFVKDRSSPKAYKQWTIYKTSLINKICAFMHQHKPTRVVCLIPVCKNQSLLYKSITSLTKQSVKPHPLLLVSSNHDKTFAINHDLEFFYSNSSSLGHKLQSGLQHLRFNYHNLEGVLICSGYDLYTLNWINEALRLSSNSDIVGTSSDHIYDRINKQLYCRSYNNNDSDHSHIYSFAFYITFSAITSVNWSLFPDTMSDFPASLSLSALDKLSLTHVIDNGIITVYTKNYIKLLQGCDHYNISSVSILPPSKSLLLKSLTFIPSHSSPSVTQFKSSLITPSQQYNNVLPSPPKSILNTKRIPSPVTSSPRMAISLNNFFEHIFVINLDRRTDRMDHIEDLFSKHNISFERISAIDGSIRSVLHSFKSLKRTKILTASAYGCLLSHIKAVELARKRRYKNILIFEDDIIFHNKFKTLLHKIHRIPKFWEILYLGCSQKKCNQYKPSSGFYVANKSRGTFAYAINGSIYNDVLRLWKIRDHPVDVALETIQARKKSYVIHENLIIAEVKNTNIQSKRDMIQSSKDVKWDLTMYNYWDNSTFFTVSIVLPTYNGFPLIKRAIKSIMSQSYHNWELIIVNDGSTDSQLVDYLNSVSSPKIKVIHLPHNCGLPHALNRGIERCNGQYWTWISDDNEFLPNCLEQLKTLLDNGSQFVYSDYYFINELKGYNSVVTLESYTLHNIVELWKGMPCYMWKSSALSSIGSFNESLHGGEDFDFVIRSFIVLHNNISYCNTPLFRYYRRNNTITTNLGNKIALLKTKIINSYTNRPTFHKLFNNISKHPFTISFIDQNNHPSLTHLFNLCPFNKIIASDTTTSHPHVNRTVFLNFLKIFSFPKTKLFLIYNYPTKPIKSYFSFLYSDSDRTTYKLFNSHISTQKILSSPSHIHLPNSNNITPLSNFINNLVHKDKSLLTIGLLYPNCSLFKYCTYTHVNDPCANIIFLNNIIFNPEHPEIFDLNYLKKPIYLINLSISSKTDSISSSSLTHLAQFFTHKNILYISVSNSYTQYWLSHHLNLSSHLIFVCPDIYFYLHKHHPSACPTQEIIGFSSGLKNNPTIAFADALLAKGYDIIWLPNPDTNNSNSHTQLLQNILKCCFVYSDDYYTCLVCFNNNIPVVGRQNSPPFEGLFDLFQCKHMLTFDVLPSPDIQYSCIEHLDVIKTSLNLHIFNLQKIIFKNHIRIAHLGSYWQHDNDIVKLMVNDLKQLATVIEIDLLLYDDCFNSTWISKYEPLPKAYPNRFIRYIKKNKLTQLIDQHKPHIIITNSAGITFTDDSFSLLNNHGIITIGISLSDPDVYPYNGKIYSHFYDYYYTNSLLSLQTQYQRHSPLLNCSLLPFACSTSLHKPINCHKNFDIVIVGNCRPDRIKIIDKLKQFFNVGVFGLSWPSSYNAFRVNGYEHVKALNRGHVYISFCKTVAGYLNVKVGLFEAAACKLVLVADYFNEIKHYFKENDEIILYRNVNDLLRKLRNLFANPKRISAMQIAAHNRFLRDHTWTLRWQSILINKLFQ